MSKSGPGHLVPLHVSTVYDHLLNLVLRTSKFLLENSRFVQRITFVLLFSLLIALIHVTLSRTRICMHGTSTTEQLGLNSKIFETFPLYSTGISLQKIKFTHFIKVIYMWLVNWNLQVGRKVLQIWGVVLVHSQLHITKRQYKLMEVVRPCFHQCLSQQIWTNVSIPKTCSRSRTSAKHCKRNHQSKASNLIFFVETHWYLDRHLMLLFQACSKLSISPVLVAFCLPGRFLP